VDNNTLPCPPQVGSIAATRLLAGYRARLAELLHEARLAAPAEPAAIRFALSDLVDDLNDDLLHLYRRAESQGPQPAEGNIVIAALERLRDVLRQRDRGARPMRDTLHKALGGFAPGA
jgi:hypothetical protein